MGLNKVFIHFKFWNLGFINITPQLKGLLMFQTPLLNRWNLTLSFPVLFLP